MFEKEIEKYTKLNHIAEGSGTVILGNGSDTQIPIFELTNAFKMNAIFYNRSALHLSIKDAIAYYDSAVKPLNPKRIILHIGASDIDLFTNNCMEFDTEYRNLIEHIRKNNKNCNIGIVSLKNVESNETIDKLNSHLRMIAESEQCEFEDISVPRVWSPTETKSAISFASSMGLCKKADNHKSLYDLAKIFFGLNLECM